jgi:endogenous inhibitor of DNA gyrase (YacG/DUF329 family)
MTKEPPKLHCPACHRVFEPNLTSAAMPFCSVRCKMADLNHWFDESIGLPVHASDVEESDSEPPPPPPAQREWRFD